MYEYTNQSPLLLDQNNVRSYIDRNINSSYTSMVSFSKTDPRLQNSLQQENNQSESRDNGTEFPRPPPHCPPREENLYENVDEDCRHILFKQASLSNTIQ